MDKLSLQVDTLLPGIVREFKGMLGLGLETKHRKCPTDYYAESDKLNGADITIFCDYLTSNHAILSPKFRDCVDETIRSIE